MIAKIISFSAGPLHFIPIQDMTVDFYIGLEEILKLVEDGDDHPIRPEFTYRNQEGKLVSEEMNCRITGRKHDKNITILAVGSSRGILHTDIKIPK